MDNPDESPIAQGRLQLYVDDPALTLRGSADQQQVAIDAVLLWWLCLGIPLAWSKGAYMDGRTPHEWIGVKFWSSAAASATMSVGPCSRSPWSSHHRPLAQHLCAMHISFAAKLGG